MKGRRYELKVFKPERGDMGLLFSEKPAHREKATEASGVREFAIWGVPLKAMTETLLGTLKKQGYRPTEFSFRRKEPFVLDEPSGVRLGLFFYALKPLRKVSRMEEIISGIDRMSDEETYYWYAKCANGSNASRARKALRILLSGG
ncbi:MAG: hypothetical protein C4576_14205 [Desulfobacteraceae bacterium]|nr:MAG: hypothetical protein C4576_14205 [Desulfobacteraceae bacterium]